MNSYRTNLQRYYAVVLIVVLAAAFFTCDHKYETIFNQSPDERVQQALDEYTALLQAAPFGWNARLYTGAGAGAGAGYFYYLDFNEDGNVSMLSDFNETSAADPMTASWVIKALLKPTLSFNTYSYIHLPADPDGNVNGGTNGEGLTSDFEFTFARTSTDTIVLQGLKHNAEMILVKATEEDTQSLYAQDILAVLQDTKVYVAENKGLFLPLTDELVVPLAIDVDRKMVAAQYLSTDATKIEQFTSPFTFTLEGVHLKSPLKIGTHIIHDLYWDEDKGAYFVPENGIALFNSTEPFIFNPSTALHQVIGNEHKRAYIPENPAVNFLPGYSAEFLRVHNEAAVSMHEGIYALSLHDITLVFDGATNQMYLDLIVSQVVNGALQKHIAEYVYTYTKDAAGNIDFTPTQANGVAQEISFDLRSLLQYLDEDTFSLKYIAGGFELIGGFYSQENPEFHFSGYLLP